jgi:uncharacterized protein YukE
MLDQSVEDSQLQARDMEAVRNELQSTKNELARISSILNDKQGALDNLQQSLETDSMGSLKSENQKYRQEIEELQAQLARGGGAQTDDSSDLSKTLTPLLIKIFDPNTSQFENAYDNFVSAVSRNGDVFQKIIATLIKKGGGAPIENVKAAVSSDEFDSALDYLIENEILKIVDHKLMIVTSDTVVSSDTNWDSMNVGEVFDTMRNVMEVESDQNVVRSIEKFRDTLQEREVPAKIFFEIRKMSEGIAAKSISRQDAVEQIDDWRRRVGSM